MIEAAGTLPDCFEPGLPPIPDSATKPLTPRGRAGKTGLEFFPQLGCIEPLTDEHQLVFGLARPIIAAEGIAPTAEVKDMSLWAFLKPQHPFGTKDCIGQLVEKILESIQREGLIALKG